MQEQNGVLCLWAQVRPSNEVEVRTFHIFGTGHEIPEDVRLSYISTAQIGSYVFHVYVEDRA